LHAGQSRIRALVEAAKLGAQIISVRPGYLSVVQARAPIATAQHGIEPKDDLRQPRITGLPRSRLIYGCPSAHGGQNRRQEVFANFTT